MTNQTIWTTLDRRRYFLLPEDANLPGGALQLRTSTGRQIEVDEEATAPYEVSEEEAKAWLKAQLGEVLGEAKTKLTGFVERLREKTAELRAENEAAWAEGDADKPPGPGRQAAERLGAFLQDLGTAIQKGAAERRAETGSTDESEHDETD